jgi:hypothetical protein
MLGPPGPNTPSWHGPAAQPVDAKFTVEYRRQRMKYLLHSLHVVHLTPQVRTEHV